MCLCVLIQTSVSSLAMSLASCFSGCLPGLEDSNTDTRFFQSGSPVGTVASSGVVPACMAILDHVSGTNLSSTLTVQLNGTSHSVIIECLVVESNVAVSCIMPAGMNGGQITKTCHGKDLKSIDSCICINFDALIRFCLYHNYYSHSGLPGVPGDLEVISQRSDGNESTIVDLRWSPPEDTGGVTLDHYTLTITSPSPPLPFLPLTILTNDTTNTVTLPSNMTYNMAVTASNCAGTSLGRSELLNLSFSKCKEYNTVSYRS